MNKKHESKKKIIIALLQMMADHKALWQTAPGFKAVVDRLTALDTEIDLRRMQQSRPLEPLTKARRDLRKALAALVLATARALAEHAKSIGDAAMLADATVKRGRINRGRQAFALSEGERIEKLALAHPTIVAALTTDGQTLPRLSAAIIAYRDSVETARHDRNQRTAATDVLDEHFQEVTKLVDQLDTLMELFAKSEPDFYRDYHLARIDTEPGPRKKTEDTATTPAATPGIPQAA